MKKIFSFMSLSLVMLLASCSQDNVVEEEATAPEEGRLVTISAGIAEDKDSRLIYDDPTGDITWNKEDKLYVLGFGMTADGEMDISRSVFDYQSGAGTKTAKFTGMFYPGAMFYTVSTCLESIPEEYWPRKQSSVSSAMKDPTQYVNNPMGHISENITLMNVPEETITPELFLAGKFSMQPEQTLFCIDLKSAPAELGNIARASLHLSYLKHESADPVRFSQTLNISGEMKTGKLYFLINSANYRPELTSIDLDLSGKDGTIYSATAPLKGPNPFKRGHRYYYTATTAGGGGHLTFK